MFGFTRSHIAPYFVLLTQLSDRKIFEGSMQKENEPRTVSKDGSTNKSFSKRTIFCLCVLIALFAMGCYLSYKTGTRHKKIKHEVHYLKKHDKELKKDLEVLKIRQNQTKRLLKHLVWEGFSGNKKDHYSSSPKASFDNNQTDWKVNKIKRTLNGLVRVVTNLTVAVSKKFVPYEDLALANFI